jgi:hypothetical protein
MSEAGTAGIWWRKSSYSGGDNNCVEVGMSNTGIAVRDSKNPDRDVLAVGAGAWQAFMGSLCSRRNCTAS